VQAELYAIGREALGNVIKHAQATEVAIRADVLNRMMVPSTKLGQVRLESVATIGRGFGPSTLWRYNREFQVSVYANVASGYPLDLAAAHPARANASPSTPTGVSTRVIPKVLQPAQWPYSILQKEMN